MLLSTEGIDPNRAMEDGCDSSVHCLPEGPSGRRAHAVECGWDRSESGQEGWSDPIVDSVSDKVMLMWCACCSLSLA